MAVTIRNILSEAMCSCANISSAASNLKDPVVTGSVF